MKISLRLITSLIVSIFLFLVSCREKFNSTKWKANHVDWRQDDFRVKMAEDLVESYTLIGKDTMSVIKLLGEPEDRLDRTYTYHVYDKFGWNIDPDYIQKLIVTFDQSWNVVKCEITKS